MCVNWKLLCDRPGARRMWMELSYLLISGSLLFTFGYYYLLKTYLVEWGCRKVLKHRVQIAARHSDDSNRGNAGTTKSSPGTTGDAASASDSDKTVKSDFSNCLTAVTKGDLAEVAQL